MRRRSQSPQHPIRRLRLAAGLSVRALAGSAGLDFRRLSLIERGFSQGELRRLARALKCHPDNLEVANAR
jgi:transcriptional regulator with XRE-family HTH domain